MLTFRDHFKILVKSRKWMELQFLSANGMQNDWRLQ